MGCISGQGNACVPAVQRGGGDIVCRVGLDRTVSHRGHGDGGSLGVGVGGFALGVGVDTGAGCRTVVKHILAPGGVAVHLKQQGEAGGLDVGILDNQAVFAFCHAPDVKHHLFGEHSDFKIAGIAVVALADVVHNAVRVELRNFALGIQRQRHAAGDGNRGVEGDRAIFASHFVLGVVRVFEIEKHFIFRHFYTSIS